MHPKQPAVGTVIAITGAFDYLSLTADVGNFERGKMLKITRAANGEVAFTESGRMDAENLVELKTLLSSQGRAKRITLYLTELTLGDNDAVRFFMVCESNTMQL